MNLPILITILLAAWTILCPVVLSVIFAARLEQRVPDRLLILIGGPIAWYLCLACVLRDRRLERERVARALDRAQR